MRAFFRLGTVFSCLLKFLQYANSSLELHFANIRISFHCCASVLYMQLKSIDYPLSVLYCYWNRCLCFINYAWLLTGSFVICLFPCLRSVCAVWPLAPGYSRERTSPNERPDESKRHTLSGPPNRSYPSDEKVDEQSLSVNTTPEEVSRSEKLKEEEALKKSKVRTFYS